MRLINATTLELVERFNNIPPYAILSHTWGDGEVSFGDWKDLDEARKKKGFRKIELTCQQAVKDGFEYVWVDTNCIDKTSSAELSEAINSMFAWYRDSQVCYVFMNDVSVPEDIRNGPPSSFLNDPAVETAFKKSKWFTRGWTLQELLAPAKVLFYSREWLPLATKLDQHRLIRDITGIDLDYIRRPGRVLTASVARRMSFMAKRKTTRIEDTAYCLLGIFGIHMALLYGEGHRAFLRLQEEIIRVSNDQTIFCWQTNHSRSGNKIVRHLFEDTELYGISQDSHRLDELRDWTSILAPHPSVFRDSGLYLSDVGQSNMENEETNRARPFSVTNFGLSLSVPLLYTSKGACAVLDVGYRRNSKDKASHVLVLLHRVSNGDYIRLSNKLLVTAVPAALTKKRTQIYVDCRNARPRGADLMLTSRLSSHTINMSDINHHPIIFLAFNRPVDIEKKPVASVGMDFMSFHSAVEVSDTGPGLQNAIILTGKTSKAETFHLLVSGRFSKTAKEAPRNSFSPFMKSKDPELDMDWHADVFDWPPDDMAWTEESLKYLVDQLPGDAFGSWYSSSALKNVFSWKYSPNGALICYFELDELQRPSTPPLPAVKSPILVDEGTRFSHLQRSQSDMASLQNIFSAHHEDTNEDEEIRTTGMGTKTMPVLGLVRNSNYNNRQYASNASLESAMASTKGEGKSAVDKNQK